MTATLDSVVALAASKVGYREGADNDTPFGRWYGLNFQPWCDVFVSWCAASVGATDVVGKFAYCPSHVTWFRARGQFGSQPRRGAIVFYSWDRNGVADHVGIVEAVGRDGSIQTIEGNTSSGAVGSQGNGNGCWRRLRLPTYVLGYGYPAYADPAHPAIASLGAAVPRSSGSRVSLEHLRVAILLDGPAADGHTGGFSAEVRLVEQSLAVEGYLALALADGSAGTSTFGAGSAYQHWQRSLGYRGADADGYPGPDSLAELGRRHGWSATA